MGALIGSFLMSRLGLEIVGGLLLIALAVGGVAYRDHTIRAEEAEKWKPKLIECQDANATLKLEYKSFVDRHNKMVSDDAERSRRTAAAREKAKAEADKRAAAEQPKIDAALVAARAQPYPSKEEACAKADDTLRALAVDLVRDDQANK